MEALHLLATFTGQREPALGTGVAQQSALDAHLDCAVHLGIAAAVRATELAWLVEQRSHLACSTLHAVGAHPFIVEVGKHDAERAAQAG